MARCSNCKAPLKPGSLICEYCNNRNDVDLRGIHYYTTHDSDSPRICPRCTTKLKTIDLKLQGKFLIERCETCFGLFFDPGELEALLQALVHDVNEIDHRGLDAINVGRASNQYPISYIKCPVCAELMNRVNFGAKSGVVVDRCKQHGVWLDGGELRQLLEWMKLGGQMLEQERQERLRRETEQREQEQRLKVKGYADEPSSFSVFSEPLRNSDPDLFQVILKALGSFLIKHF